MIRKLIAIFVEAFVFLSCTSLIAQEKQKPMTNADVVEMVQSGMTEEAIVGAIKAATPNFEITNDSTTALSKQQISERVILAMIRRQIEWDQSHPKIKAPVHRAPSNDTRPKWEVEFHGGISRTHHVGGWQHPPAAEAYSLAGSGASGYWGKRVSSWYFGDGAELIGLSSSLDSTLVGLKPAIQPQKNQMFGLRPNSRSIEAANGQLHLYRNPITTFLDANHTNTSDTAWIINATDARGESVAFLQRLSGPGLEAYSTLSGPTISGLRTFYGSGVQRQTPVTLGLFWRF